MKKCGIVQNTKEWGLHLLFHTSDGYLKTSASTIKNLNLIFAECSNVELIDNFRNGNTVSNYKTDGISPAEIGRAIDLIQDQGPTPLSPGLRTSDGTVRLCAGAALAAAGLEARQKTGELSDLRETISASSDSECIRIIFSDLGWSRELCDSVILTNDTLEESERDSGVVKFLQSLHSDATQLCQLDA